MGVSRPSLPIRIWPGNAFGNSHHPRERNYGSLSLGDMTSTAATWTLKMLPDRPKSPPPPLLSVLQSFTSYDTTLSVQLSARMLDIRAQLGRTPLCMTVMSRSVGG